MTQQFPPSSSANAPQLRVGNQFRTHTSLQVGWLLQTTSCSFYFLFYFLKQSEANALKLHSESTFLCFQCTNHPGLCSEAGNCKEWSKLMSKPTPPARDLSCLTQHSDLPASLCRNNTAAEHSEGTVTPCGFSQDWSKIPFHRAKDNLESLPFLSSDSILLLVSIGFI